jgi:RNA polymerase primary sigma factor
LKEIAAFPLLTRDEESALALRMRDGDKHARERLICSNLRLVVSQARKFNGMGVSIEDLIAEGNAGLITAVERFKPQVGAGLCTYAVWWIRQRMMHAIEHYARTVRLPAHVLSRLRKLQTATAQLTQILGREPEAWEIAQQAGVSEEKFRSLMTAAAPVASLDESEAGEGASLMDRLVADENAAPDPGDAACRTCDADRARCLLTNLPDRLRLVIERRFGINCDYPQPLHEIGKLLGVTRERIRQLECRALALLRKAAYRMDPAENASLADREMPIPCQRVQSLRGKVKRNAA